MANMGTYWRADGSGPAMMAEQERVVRLLAKLMQEANAADSDDNRSLWTVPEDASHRSVWGHLEKALREIAGSAFVDYLIETGEVDMSLTSVRA